MSKASAPMSDPPPPYAPPPGFYPGLAPPGQNPAPMPYPQNNYAPQYGQGPPTVQVAQVIVTSGLGPHSTSTVCPSCQQQVLTRTEPVAGLLTWILSGTLVMLGCWLGCCLIPCCVRECQDIEHKCPNCKAHLGLYRRL